MTEKEFYEGLTKALNPVYQKLDIIISNHNKDRIEIAKNTDNIKDNKDDLKKHEKANEKSFTFLWTTIFGSSSLLGVRLFILKLVGII